MLHDICVHAHTNIDICVHAHTNIYMSLHLSLNLNTHSISCTSFVNPGPDASADLASYVATEPGPDAAAVSGEC